jgi:hypothetical protein
MWRGRLRLVQVTLDSVNSGLRLRRLTCGKASPFRRTGILPFGLRMMNTSGASPPPDEHVLAAKRWTVSNRGRKPTVGKPRNAAQPRRGCPRQFGPFRAGCRLMTSHPWVSPTAIQGAPLRGVSPGMPNLAQLRAGRRPSDAPGGPEGCLRGRSGGPWPENPTGPSPRDEDG